MLQLNAQLRLFIAIEPIDFRHGIEGLIATCQQELYKDPFSGGVFIFRDRRGTSVKCLTYDGNGFWHCQKRFSSASLAWWPSSTSAVEQLSAAPLQVLLAQGRPTAIDTLDDWRPIHHAA